MKYRKTLLIVCEGQRTEPNYFDDLRTEVIEKCGNDVYIKILPLPNLTDIENDVNSFVLRRGAKRRILRESLTMEKIDDYSVEDKYRAQPISYVRKAQQGYLEHGYDELWAAYDKDEHPKQQEAFLLSCDIEECDKIVNLAFSSISFETWILLHFVYDETQYKKSACRSSKYDYHNCGTNTDKRDCDGKECVCGRIIASKFLSPIEGKFFSYSDFGHFYKQAIINSIKLRSKHEAYLEEFYELNPYTTVDKLVLKLKLLDKIDLIWIYKSELLIENGIPISLSKNESKIIILVTNQSNARFILSPDHIRLLDFNLDFVEIFNRTIIDNGSSLELTIEFSSFPDFNHIIFLKSAEEGYVLDLPTIKNIT